MVLSETEFLVREGNDPARALEAAFGAVLVARRKQHWRMLLNEIIPFQAKKIASGIYEAATDPKERARRIDNLVNLIRPDRAWKYKESDAVQRLRELGLSSEEIKETLQKKRMSAHDVALELSGLLDAGIAGPAALEEVLRKALREYVLEFLMSQPVACGIEYCIWASVVSAAVSVIGTVVGIAVPLAQQKRARREAAQAQSRQQAAPLMIGEIQQLAAALVQSYPAWNATARQAALDYVRVNRFGRASFVGTEESQLRQQFTAYRQAIIAREQAEQNKKIMIGLGVAALAIGGIVAVKKLT